MAYPKIPWQTLPYLDTAAEAHFQLEGLIGERLRACLEQWWLIAPDANPAILQMFRDRDRLPMRNLLPWSGEFIGKFLTSAVLGWRLTRDRRLHQLIARLVDELIAVQDSDGYLGPFARHERLTGVGKIAGVERDIPLWDLWGHYHGILGLLLWYEATAYQPALDTCCRAADLLCKVFLDGTTRVYDAGSEEMNMAISHGLCLLYEVTGNDRYLSLVREIESDWEKPPAGDYVRQALAGKAFYETPKPRWESLHDVQAIAELYWITGEPTYRTAFEQIWWSIQAGDRHNTGGFSSGEQATGNPYDPRAIETCCTVAWMATSVDMLRLGGNPVVADELELSLFNGLLGGQSPTGRWWTYDTPMDGVKKASAHDIVFQARPGSPELNCCSVNAPRGLAMLSQWAVMVHEEALAINFYGPGTTTVTMPGGGSLRLQQETGYPLGGNVRIRLGLAEESDLGLDLRIPSWSRETRLQVNGEPVPDVQAGTYVRLKRRWRAGDLIELDLDMSLHFWFGERECAGQVSIYRGPLLLAYDPRYNEMDLYEIPAVRVDELAFTVETWEGPLPPWLLLRFPMPNGRWLYLCDFANAGMTGTQYQSWLPAAVTVPRPPSRTIPIWTAHPHSEGQ